MLDCAGPLLTWHRPASLAELLELKAAHPQAKIVVGNTEVGRSVGGEAGDGDARVEERELNSASSGCLGSAQMWGSSRLTLRLARTSRMHACTAGRWALR